MLAEAAEHAGQVEAELHLLVEAYCLQGVLLQQQAIPGLWLVWLSSHNATTAEVEPALPDNPPPWRPAPPPTPARG
jgi:hypothetical protein